MKTVEQLIFEKRFKDEEFDPDDYNDWVKENEYEAYQLCLQVAKQYAEEYHQSELLKLNKSDVMPSVCRCTKEKTEIACQRFGCMAYEENKRQTDY